MREFWTKEQEEALRKYWHQPVNLKAYLHLFGKNRSYRAVISHGQKYLHLGSRSKPARQAGWAWNLMKEDLKKNGPGSTTTIVMRTGLSKAAVGKYLGLAKIGPEGEIHILEFRKRTEGGKPAAVYAFGPGENDTEPEPFTSKEKYKMLRTRLKAKRNPFATAILNVTGVENISPKGQYKSRVYREAELETA